MEQTLCINIKNNGRILAQEHYRRSGYTDSSFALTMEIIENFFKNDVFNNANPNEQEDDAQIARQLLSGDWINDSLAKSLLKMDNVIFDNSDDENLANDAENASLVLIVPKRTIDIDLGKQTAQILLEKTTNIDVNDERNCIINMAKLAKANPANGVSFYDFERVFWEMFNGKYQDEDRCFFKFAGSYYRSIESSGNKTQINYRLAHESSIFEAFKKPDAEEIIISLLKKGANVNVRDEFGNSPLHIAAKLGNEKLIKIFIKAKANINAKNVNLRTPLSIAVSKRNMDIAKLLLDLGAEVGTLDVCFKR